MSENLTQRWAIAGQVLPFELANALAEINGWTDDSNEYQSCLRGWRDDLFRLAISGELTFKSAQGVPLPSCADAFYLGFVDLHDFCEWAARVGSTGIPKDPHALAKALGFDVEPQAVPVVANSASDGVEPDAPDWRMQIQAEAYARWLRLRASGCNPTVHSICDDIAKWCIEQNIKGGKGQNPRAGTIRNTVLGAGHWTPPHHSVAEAKQVAQIARTAQTQVAQIAR